MSLDPRAHYSQKLTAPDPLPHISRKALKRVKNPLPVPTACPYCDGEVRLVSHLTIYGREYGEWPYAYACLPCNAYVGLHPHTDIPLGTLADRGLRLARMDNKKLFLQVQKHFQWTRRTAYHWLAEALGIPVGQCHWGWFDRDLCTKAGMVCAAKLNSEGLLQ